jgi:hypothetical protein
MGFRFCGRRRRVSGAVDRDPPAPIPRLPDGVRLGLILRILFSDIQLNYRRKQRVVDRYHSSWSPTERPLGSARGLARRSGARDDVSLGASTAASRLPASSAASCVWSTGPLSPGLSTRISTLRVHGRGRCLRLLDGCFLHGVISGSCSGDIKSGIGSPWLTFSSLPGLSTRTETFTFRVLLDRGNDLRQLLEPSCLDRDSRLFAGGRRCRLDHRSRCGFGTGRDRAQHRGRERRPLVPIGGERGAAAPSARTIVLASTLTYRLRRENCPSRAQVRQENC